MKKNTALLIIDMINKMDFVGSDDLLRNTTPIIDPLLHLKTEAREHGLPIIYVNDNYGLWHEDVTSLIEECQNGKGKEIVEQFIPEERDYFIIKPKHSGFHGTQLDILLKQLDVENLILTGIASDICVHFTAIDAYMREYYLWIPSDCSASETTRDHLASLRLLKRSTFANISSTTDTEIEKAFASNNSK